MLEIYPFILETITLLRPVTVRITRADSDLGRQLRRATSSSALNVAEGRYSRGRNKQARYHTALGSARETWPASRWPKPWATWERSMTHSNSKPVSTASSAPWSG